MEKNLQALNQQEKEQLWAKRMVDCLESGLTVGKWCEEDDIKVPTFYNWQRKLSQKATQSQKFTEISVTETQEISTTIAPKIIATMTINEIKAEIYAGSSANDIQNLVRGVKSC